MISSARLDDGLEPRDLHERHDPETLTAMITGDGESGRVMARGSPIGAAV
ncbi:MAG: hypothetical protein V3T64_01355 [Myxococcota bacterium]